MVPELPGERTRGRADSSKARELGWAPRLRLDQYIAEFVGQHPRD
jgi:UDP-glucose 4-epimerase